MEDAALKTAIERAKLTSSHEGMGQLKKEISEEKHDREVQSQIDRLEKIYKELHTSNELMQKQIDEAKVEAASAKKKAFWASFRAWLSIGISIIAVIASFIIAKFF